MSIKGKTEFLCRAADVCGNRLRALLGVETIITDNGKEKDKEVFASVSLPEADYIGSAAEFLHILATMNDTEVKDGAIKPILLRVSVPKYNGGALRLSLSPRMSPRTAAVCFAFLGGHDIPNGIDRTFAESVLRRGGVSDAAILSFLGAPAQS